MCTKRPKYGKSPRQIRRYMRRQPWWRSFCRLTWMEQGHTIRECMKVLYGFEGVNTITHAFEWHSTVQGAFYWETIDKDFRKWYMNTD